MKVFVKHQSRRQRLLEPLGHMVATRKRAAVTLAFLLILFGTTIAYAVSTVPVSNTQGVNWSLSCTLAGGGTAPACLTFVSSTTPLADGSFSYILRARDTGSSVLSNLAVSTVLTQEPTGAAVLLNGSPLTVGVPVVTNGPFNLSPNVDQTFTFSVSFGTGGPVAGYYNLEATLVQ